MLEHIVVIYRGGEDIYGAGRKSSGSPVRTKEGLSAIDLYYYSP